MSNHTIMKMLAIAILFSVLLVASLDAEDWPQWRGADRLAIWTENGIIGEGGMGNRNRCGDRPVGDA